MMGLDRLIDLLPWAARGRHHASYEGVLGTSLDLEVTSRGRSAAGRAEIAVLSEIERLARIFSVHAATSELLRWSEEVGAAREVSADLAIVLEEAQRWRILTRGAFDPMIGRFPDCRSDAAAARFLNPPARPPTDLPYWIVERGEDRAYARKLVPGPVTLDAIAKGFIVDRAAEAAAAVPGVEACLLNVGGDLRHIGSEPILVGVTDPRTGAENEVPVATVLIGNMGVATSGGYRRDGAVSGKGDRHIVDGRDPRRAPAVSSATVVAETAMSADALATALVLMEVEEGLELVDSLVTFACLLVTPSGEVLRSRSWSGLER
jgi:FAD:protein FMN transferase